MKYFKMYNDVEIPVLGYGVYQVPSDITYRCVRDALDVGYTHIDSAEVYSNEKETGQAIKDSGIDREKLFITTKVWIDSYDNEKANKSLEKSFKDLQVEYVDLVLLHHPFNDYYSAYRVLEKWYKDGRVRSIGLSNFYPDRLSDMASFNEITPMVDQVEINPFFQQEKAINNMRRHNVLPEAWAPFAEGKNDIFKNEKLNKIADKHNKSVSQVILKWLVERGVVALSKTTHKDRMIENINCLDFNLDDEDKIIIKSLDTNRSAFYDHRDPKTVDMFLNKIELRKKQKEEN